MGPMLGRVMDIGRGAASAGKRVAQAPGNVMAKGLDALESSTYNHLMRNAGDRAETLAQNIYMGKDFARPQDSNMAKMAFDRIRDVQFGNIQDASKFQAALVPGGMRFAGRAAKSPLAMTAYGVGGTLAVGNMLEEQGQREQLMQMGLSPEEAEILANELAMAAQNMEPTEYV